MDPFGYVGAGLGSLLGGVGRVLEPLDYPRRALWGLPGALARGDWEEALPGIGALGVGAGLAATGVGLPLAALGGAVAGGLGTAAAGGLEDAPRGADLIRMLGGNPESWGGWGAGMALDVAGDPLTYAGGLGGRHLATPEALEQARRFLGEETGALKLKYDPITDPLSIGLARNDPKWINNRTFYHGSGTPGLTAETLDPLKTDPGNLFGQGIYKSDKLEIPESHAMAAPSRFGSSFRSRAIEAIGGRQGLLESGRAPALGTDPDLLAYAVRNFGDDYLKKIADKPHIYGYDTILDMLAPGHPKLTSLAHKILSRHGFHVPSPPIPTLYQAQSDFGKILDLDQPVPKELIDPIMEQARRMTRASQAASEAYDTVAIDPFTKSSGSTVDFGDFTLTPPHQPPPYEELHRLLTGGRTAGEAVNWIDQYADDIKDMLAMAETGHPMVQAQIAGLPMVHSGEFDIARKMRANRAFREAGYDALTHTGGQRIGGLGEHQVVIGLDPNDVMGIGRKTPYRIWEAIKDFARDETGAMKFAAHSDPEIAKLLDAMGPEFPGGIEKLQALAETAPETTTRGRVLSWADDTEIARRLAGEIQPGARIHAPGGAEAVAVRNPDGSIVRVGDWEKFSQGRADIPQMLQPFRETQIGPYTVEHMPQVSTMHDLQAAIDPEQYGRAGDLMRTLSNRLRSSIEKTGYHPWDVVPRNVGVTSEGRALTFDRGAVGPPPYSTTSSGLVPTPKPIYPYPDAATYAKLMEIGGPERVRGALRMGLGMGTVDQGIAMREAEEYLAMLRGEPIRSSANVPYGPIPPPGPPPVTPITRPITSTPESAVSRLIREHREAEAEILANDRGEGLTPLQWLLLQGGLGGAAMAPYYGPDLIRRMMSQSQPQAAEVLP